ncbi:MAG: stage II sporulation protein M [Alphaproteobacteria bacterium]
MKTLQLKSQRFRNEREAGWKQLETLLLQIERRGIRSLTNEQITLLPNLYRSTLSSLSAARSTSLDQNVIAYLESLSARAYYILYGAQVSLPRRLSHFFRRDWPSAASALKGETLISALIMLLGAVVAYFLVSSNPEWYFSFIPEQLAGGRSPASSTEALRETLYDSADTDSLATFATTLFSHNSRVAILAFALGFAFCIPTAILMLYNGCTLGAFVALFSSRDLGFEVGGWLIIHGATEIFAIVLAGAAGMHIGRAMAFPGRKSRAAAAAEAGQRAGTLMAGVVVMLFCAGLIEGVGRQLIAHDYVRYGIGFITFAMWCLYFYAPRSAAKPEA